MGVFDMDWHTKTIVRNAFSLLIAVLLTILFIVLFVSAINDQHNSGIFLFAFLSLFGGLIIYSTFKQLIEAIKKQKNASTIDLLSELKNINQYGSNEEMLAAFHLQKTSPLYQDKKIIITNDFLTQGEDTIFIINGILDVIPFVQKVNGIIDYVSLNFLYYDGKRYEIKYRRSLGFSDMQERVNSIKLAANIIATKSANFRKYPSYSLTN